MKHDMICFLISRISIPDASVVEICLKGVDAGVFQVLRSVVLDTYLSRDPAGECHLCMILNQAQHLGFSQVLQPSGFPFQSNAVAILYSSLEFCSGIRDY